MRVDKRKREDSRDRSVLLVRKANTYKEVVREVRERERNTRDEDVGGINKDMDELVKDLERDRDEVGTDGDYLMYYEYK